jgi:hypothetical protein
MRGTSRQHSKIAYRTNHASTWTVASSPQESNVKASTSLRGGSNDAGLNLSSSQNARVVIGGVAQAYGIMDFGSQGLLQDDATGLIYNRARYRSIELDRFISAEPSGAPFYVDGINP